jgi:hypothetical protein
MKRLLISGFVAIALLAVATTMRSYSISSDRSLVTTGATLSKKSPASRGRNQASDRRVRGYVAGVFDAGEAVTDGG